MNMKKNKSYIIWQSDKGKTNSSCFAKAINFYESA